MKGIAPDKVKAESMEVYLNWEKPLPMDMQPPKQSIDIWAGSGLLAGVYGFGWQAGLRRVVERRSLSLWTRLGRSMRRHWARSHFRFRGMSGSGSLRLKFGEGARWVRGIAYRDV